MKKPYMIMCDKCEIKALPYEEGNALPCVLAEDEKDALKVAEQIYRAKEEDYYRQDIVDYIANLNEDRNDDEKIKADEDDIECAVGCMVNHHDCNLTYWDNVECALTRTGIN